MRILLLAAAACAAAALTGCGSPKVAPHTASELEADPSLLQGILARCAENKRAAENDADCVNARLAVARLAAAEESRHTSERGAQFEREREQRRDREERSRKAAEGTQGSFDPYSSPVSTETPADPPKR
ncbi:MAG: EexN family lipoprotein [Proteobacteria bacterium]|nr:EexN family lipoprotein [Pseudomonadota bacterium]